MSFSAAKMYFDAVIHSHITYCITSWLQANKMTLKGLETLFKQSLKNLDNKPNRYHHCNILSKCKVISWDNLIKYANLCLAFKIVHCLAPPPLKQYIKLRTTADITVCGVTKRDCIILFRKSVFGQSAFSIQAAEEWNSTPQYLRELLLTHLLRN